jgi:hypothetical protein
LGIDVDDCSAFTLLPLPPLFLCFLEGHSSRMCVDSCRAECFPSLLKSRFYRLAKKIPVARRRACTQACRPMLSRGAFACAAGIKLVEIMAVARDGQHIQFIARRKQYDRTAGFSLLSMLSITFSYSSSFQISKRVSRGAVPPVSAAQVPAAPSVHVFQLALSKPASPAPDAKEGRNLLLQRGRLLHQVRRDHGALPGRGRVSTRWSETYKGFGDGIRQP